MFKRKDEDPPPGFAMFVRNVLFDDEPVRIDLLLPTPVKEDLDREAKLRREEQRKKRDDEFEADRAVKKASEVNVKGKGKGSPSAADSIDPDVEAEELQELVPGKDYDPLDLMPVYAYDQPLRLLRNLKIKFNDREGGDRIGSIYTRLKLKSNLRFINYPAAFAGNGRLARMRQSHPHFGEVIDLIQDQVVLSQATRTRLYIPPILLWGPPGVGKTHFAQELGKLLGTGMHRLAYDSELTGAALLGSDKKWSNSSHGTLFEALALGDHGNPVLLLDEIDKAYRGVYGSDPLASLHSLLEPVSSRSVVDISLDFEMDTSAVIWICTANYPRKVAPTLRSRMREFAIEMPDAEQCLLIAESVGRSVHEAMGVVGLNPPGQRITASLAHLTPREQNQALRRAFARAIVNGRLALKESDIPGEYLDRARKEAQVNPKGWLH